MTKNTVSVGFEVRVDGAGDFPAVEPSVKAVQNATLRHTAMSNIDIAIPDLGPALRDYPTFFPDVELRVQLWDAQGTNIGSERVFKGPLTEIESQGQAGEAILKTKGRGWHLEKDEAIVKFENIRVWEAIEEYLDAETDFAFDVVPDPGSPVVTDELAFDVSTQQEWEDLINGQIADSEPITISDGTLRPLQTCQTQDGDLDGVEIGGATAEDPEYTSRNPITDGQGTGWAGGSIGDEKTWTFEVDYVVPAEHVGVFVRDHTPLDGRPSFEIYFDDELVVELSGLPDTGGLLLNWTDVLDGPYGNDPVDPGDLQPGEYDLRVEIVGEEGGVYVVDHVALADLRFGYFFDNDVTTLEGGENVLDGPEWYPDEIYFEFPTIERESQIEAVRIESDWDDVSGLQALAASNDNGTNYLVENNSESFDRSFSQEDLSGLELRVRPTFGRWEPDGPQARTPRFGYAPQSISSMETRFDQTSIAVFSEIIFSESHLQNLKDMCDFGRMNFSIDHTADEKRIDVFPIGTEGDAVEWSAIDWRRTDGDEDYANRVVARGARKPEEEREDEFDLRWEADITDDDEIERLTDLGLTEEAATVSVVLTDPEWDTQEVVDQQAFNALEGFVESRLPTGMIDIVPTFVPPGYAYPIEEFEDAGETPTKVLEQVQFTEGHGQGAQGQLQFESVRNWVRAVSPVEQDVVGIKRLF